MLLSSPPQTPSINLPSQILPEGPCQAPLLTPPQMLPSNLSTGSTDWQESGNQQLHVRLPKMRNIASCLEQASSSLVRRRNYRIRTYLSPQLHINLPGRTLRQDQSS